VRVVVDTNVLVSGLLSPFGAPGEIVRMIAAGALAVCFDARIIAEYREVLARPKFSIRGEDIQALLDQVRAAGVVVAGDPLPANLPDPGDAPFLEVALAGRAACLVTGNLRHYPAPLRHGMRILGPGAFLDFYRVQRRKRRPRR
jgi:uncharacterized protein